MGSNTGGSDENGWEEEEYLRKKHYYKFFFFFFILINDVNDTLSTRFPHDFYGLLESAIVFYLDVKICGEVTSTSSSGFLF